MRSPSLPAEWVDDGRGSFAHGRAALRHRRTYRKARHDLISIGVVYRQVYLKFAIFLMLFNAKRSAVSDG